MTVQRLLAGEKEATGWEMEQIAKGFDKLPGHFVEYRTAVVLQALYQRMQEIPESSVRFFAALVGVAA
jgi:hypothetical protein